MPQKRPLTHCHVATELKKYFRKNEIHYLTFNKVICTNHSKNKQFPPLYFHFDTSKNRVTFWNIRQAPPIFKFPLTTVTQLLADLVKFQVVTPKELPL